MSNTEQIEYWNGEAGKRWAPPSAVDGVESLHELVEPVRRQGVDAGRGGPAPA